MGPCYLLSFPFLVRHLPADTDIVVVEYTFNEIPTAIPYMDNSFRAPYERLIRQVR